MIKTDIIIIGAGPVGLFTIFEAGLMKLHCHVIDAIPQIGGQLKEIYPKKPIYDIPGFPSILAGDLIDNLEKQAEPFQPGFTLGERAESIDKQEDGTFIVTTNEGTQHQAPAVIIAGGLGSFEPRKPLIENLEKFEKKGIEYMVREPEAFLEKRLFISGGGILPWIGPFTLRSKAICRWGWCTDPICLEPIKTPFNGFMNSKKRVKLNCTPMQKSKASMVIKY